MIPEYQTKLTFRLSKEERQQIDELIKQEKFKSISQVIRAALQDFLSEEVS
jgi:Arc/MetJ-type ribon-helix-helix transcriptional regulator